MKDVHLLLDATNFASCKHRDHRRLDNASTPYINHPLAVAKILSENGETDIELLMAAVLHDTVEDTDTTVEELEKLFGSEIAEIVNSVTDDKTKSKSERKQLQIVHAPTLSHKAKLLKLADKIANMTDILKSPPKLWNRKTKVKYFEWSYEVVKGLRGTNSKLETIFDELYARKNEL